MTDYGEPRRPAMDPLLSGVEEAMEAGYRTVEYVFDAFAESLRRRPVSGYEGRATGPRRHAPTAGRRSARAAASRVGTTRTGSPIEPGGSAERRGYRRGPSQEPAPLSGGLADLVVEFLDLFGEIVQDVVGGVGGEIYRDEVPRLELRAVPGEKSTKLKFRFTNTGSSALTGLGFETTALLNAAERIEPDAISFGGLPPGTRVAPGGSVLVELEVALPDDQQPGIYRGVIVATSTPRTGRPVGEAALDAWALVEVDIEAPGSSEPISFVAEAEES
jgi:hypothetical protein